MYTFSVAFRLRAKLYRVFTWLCHVILFRAKTLWNIKQRKEKNRNKTNGTICKSCKIPRSPSQTRRPKLQPYHWPARLNHGTPSSGRFPVLHSSTPLGGEGGWGDNHIVEQIMCSTAQSININWSVHFWLLCMWCRCEKKGRLITGYTKIHNNAKKYIKKGKNFQLG